MDAAESRDRSPKPAESTPGLARVITVSVAATLLLRIAWAAIVPLEPISDSAAYFSFASTIASGGGYGWEPNEPTAYWAVGPSAIYAAFFMVFGAGKFAVVLANLLFAVLGSACAVVLAERWFGRRAAWAAGVLFALWPTMIMFTTTLNSEQMFVSLLLASLVITDPCREGSWKRAAFVGPVVAAMALVRPTGLLIPAVIAGTRVLRGRGRVRPIGQGLLATAVMLACIAPWTVRNYRVFDEFVLISTNGGPNFWMGNNPETTGHYMPLPEDVSALPETERADILKSRALDYIRAEPVAFVSRSATKMLQQHTTETIAVGWNGPALPDRFGDWVISPLKAASRGLWLATLAGAAVGFVMIVRSRGFWLGLTHPCVVLWGYFATVHAVTVIQDRYHLQWSPVVMLLAAAPAASAAHWLWRRRPGASGGDEPLSANAA